MTDHQQLTKLQKIISFYEQDCDVLKRRLLQQNALVVAKQNELMELEQQLARTQQQLHNREPTAFNHQLVCHLMSSIEININRSQQELSEAVLTLQQRRTELQKKKSRIESLEKLCGIKMEEISAQDRRREQHLADERYLNTHFTGLMK